MKIIGLIYLVVFLKLFHFQEPSKAKATPSKDDFKIIGTKWYSEGNQYFANDTLYFINQNEVEYFMGEVEWTFDSHYEIKNDTVIVHTITAAFEVDDTNGLEPDLIQKYLISSNSLKLVYLGNRKNGSFIEADASRYDRINDFVKIK